MLAFFVFERTFNSDGYLFLVRRLFIQEFFNDEKSHMSGLSRKLCFCFFRLINCRFCFIYVVKTMAMICIAVKSVKTCLLVVQNRFTHELAHATRKLKF